MPSEKQQKIHVPATTRGGWVSPSLNAPNYMEEIETNWYLWQWYKWHCITKRKESFRWDQAHSLGSTLQTESSTRVSGKKISGFLEVLSSSNTLKEHQAPPFSRKSHAQCPFFEIPLTVPHGAWHGNRFTHAELSVWFPVHPCRAHLQRCACQPEHFWHGCQNIPSHARKT